MRNACRVFGQKISRGKIIFGDYGNLRPKVMQKLIKLRI
jgi:hypothetical protein